jgi:L-iditol 2-dehydrogenase
MRQMVLTGIEAMEMREASAPRIVRDTDVLIRIGAVGVCGSDIHYYARGRIGDQVVQYPFAVGHESAGTVVEVGSAVRKVKPGDRIAIDPAVPCGTCDQCRAGRAHTCRALNFLGCPGQIEGCLGELLVMPEQSCYPLARGLSLEAGAFSEPLAIGIWATELAGKLDGKAVGILGFGPIGASVLLASLRHRPRKILVTDRIPARLDVARRAGAAWVGSPDTADVTRDMVAEEPGKLDVVFECCGQQSALDQATDLLRPGGKLMFVGIPEVDRVCFTPDKLRRWELCIQSVRRQNECVRKALDLLASGAVDLDLFLTHRFPFERTKEAFDLVKDYREGVMKATVLFP